MLQLLTVALMLLVNAVTAERMHAYLSCTGIAPMNGRCSPQFVISGEPSDVLDDCNPVFSKPVVFDANSGDLEFILKNVGYGHASAIKRATVESGRAMSVISIGSGSCNLQLLPAFEDVQQHTFSIKTKPKSRLYGLYQEKLYFVISRFEDSEPIYKSEARELDKSHSYWDDAEIVWKGIKISSARVKGVDSHLLNIQLFKEGSYMPVHTFDSIDIEEIVRASNYVTYNGQGRDIDVKIEKEFTFDDLKRDGLNVELVFALDQSTRYRIDSDLYEMRRDLIAYVQKELAGLSRTYDILTFGHFKPTPGRNIGIFDDEYLSFLAEGAKLHHRKTATGDQFVEELMSRSVPDGESRLEREFDLASVISQAAEGIAGGKFRIVVVSPTVTEETTDEFFTNASNALFNVKDKPVLFIFAFARQLSKLQVHKLTNIKFGRETARNSLLMVVQEKPEEGFLYRVEGMISAFYADKPPVRL